MGIETLYAVGASAALCYLVTKRICFQLDRVELTIPVHLDSLASEAFAAETVQPNEESDHFWNTSNQPSQFFISLKESSIFIV